MSEKTKEDQIKEKLIEFFDKKLTDLTTKFTKDIETIEEYKYNYFDSVIKIYREIEEEEKKFEEQEKEKEKEKQEKKVEEPKHEKIDKKKISGKERPKTPIGTTKLRQRGDKNKDREKPHDITDIHNNKEKEKKKVTINTVGGVGNKTSRGGRINTEIGNKRPITGKSDAKSRAQIGKKPPINKKGGDKKTKGKKDAKSTKEESKEEPKEEPPKVEEKKPVIINPKYIITIPEEIKNKNELNCLYYILKKNYLDKKNILYISTSNPLLYKCLGSNMKYLLDEKKNDIDKKAKEIQSFLNNYGDLNTYLTKEFSLSKRAMGSLLMFKKKEEDEILKNQKLPSEVGLILKFICYLLDEKFDENMNEKEMFENIVKNILDKNDDKTFKGLLVNYFNKNKFLNLTQEKVDNINKIVNENNKILVMTEISKSCRPFSLFCFSLKEIYEYINLKTSDGHYYYELREKNKQLQNYLDFIYMYENNGKQRNSPKEEKKEETNAEKTKEENVEKSEEQNTENIEKPKEENLEQNEEHKNEEMKVEEESVKKEENNEQNEQPPQE